MKLKQLLNELESIETKGNLEIEINKVEMDSRKVTQGDIFIAISGYEVDGHQYIESAVKNGAVAIVVEKGYDSERLISSGIPVITVENTRRALAVIASNYYNQPSRKVKMIGLTGTKGKTTTSFMIKNILEKMGHKVGLIGSIATYIGNEKLHDNDRTTPDGLSLQTTFNKMVNENVDTIVMEVASQALKLDRVYGVEFDYAVFTNLSEDHISAKEHSDMDDYFNAKAKLFDNCKMAFLNADDKNAMRIADMNKKCEIRTYGIENNADVMANNVEVESQGTRFNIKFNKNNIEKIDNKNSYAIDVAIPGLFSVYNALAAISVTTEMGASIENVREALKNISVPGRSELVPNEKGLTIMIDFSHSPAGLKNILEASKHYVKGRIIDVFGCGGNRDSAKRPVMGKISGELADFTIITSDNPRFENPKEIINQIEVGMKETNGKYICIENRIEAIKYAIEMANKDDMIILAGKGHEPYQEIKGEKFDFDERKIVGEIIANM